MYSFYSKFISDVYRIYSNGIFKRLITYFRNGENMKNKQKLELVYPCEWIYKIIGNDSKAMEHAVSSIITTKMFTLTESNESRNGKYCSLNLTLIVENEEERQGYYKNLGMHKDIRMVL